MDNVESGVISVGVVAFLLIPLIAIYLMGAFILWDMSWIADAAYREARTWVAVIQGLWLLIVSLAASSS